MPRPKGSALLFGTAAVAGTVLSVIVANGQTVPVARWGLAGQLAVWAVAWIVGTAAVFRLDHAQVVILVIIVGLGLRVAALAGPPVLSDDVFRYSWDGRVQAAGVDPYADPPASPRLAGLREGWLWPDTLGCHTIGRPAGCTRVNRPPERTIYPPGAEAVFAAAYRVGGIGSRYKIWQVTGLLADLATMVLLAVGLRRWGRDPRWVALYALCPAPVVDFVNNGHVDAVAVMLLVAAFVFAVPPRETGAGPPDRIEVPWRDLAFGLLVGGAVLVKLYPGLLLVAALGLPRLRPARALLRSAAVAGGLVVMAYLPHVLAVGLRVLGYLSGYLHEEGYAHGGRFLLAGALGLHGAAATVASGGAFVLVLAWVVKSRPPAPHAALFVLAAALLAATPVQSWYAVSLIAFAALASAPWWAAVAVAGYPYFIAVLINDPRASLWGRAAYGTALLVGLAGSAGLLGRPTPVAPAEARQ